MDINHQKDEVLLSWRRCIEQKISTAGKGIKISDNEVNNLLKNNSILISTFEDILGNSQSGKYLFLYYRIKPK